MGVFQRLPRLCTGHDSMLLMLIVVTGVGGSPRMESVEQQMCTHVQPIFYCGSREFTCDITMNEQ